MVNLNIVGAFVRSSLQYASDLVLPPLCVGCSALVDRHSVVCPRCWSNLHLITPPICDRLGLPLPGSTGAGPFFSTDALVNPPAYERARAAGFYAGLLRRLIVRFKFEDRHEALPLFTSLMLTAGRDLLADADVIVPVPLHRLRLLHRRFNQSALLAKGLARRTGKPVETNLLLRVMRTRPQVGLRQGERRENVHRAFAIDLRKASRIAGQRVLLVDDVITTGATADACARALLRAGSAAVDVLAIAMVTPIYRDDILDEYPAG